MHVRGTRISALFTALGAALLSIAATAGPALAAVETKPAGGSEISQVVIATSIAMVATGVLLWAAISHRRRR